MVNERKNVEYIFFKKKPCFVFYFNVNVLYFFTNLYKLVIYF